MVPFQSQRLRRRGATWWWDASWCWNATWRRNGSWHWRNAPSTASSCLSWWSSRPRHTNPEIAMLMHHFNKANIWGMQERPTKTQGWMRVLPQFWSESLQQISAQCSDASFMQGYAIVVESSGYRWIVLSSILFLDVFVSIPMQSKGRRCRKWCSSKRCSGSLQSAGMLTPSYILDVTRGY